MLWRRNNVPAFVAALSQVGHCQPVLPSVVLPPSRQVASQTFPSLLPPFGEVLPCRCPRGSQHERMGHSEQYPVGPSFWGLAEKQTILFPSLCGHEGCKTLSVQSGKTSRGKSIGKSKVRKRCCVLPIRTHQSFNLDSNPSDRPKAAMWPYAWRRWGKGAAPTSEPAGQATAVTRGR